MINTIEVKSSIGVATRCNRAALGLNIPSAEILDKSLIVVQLLNNFLLPNFWQYRIVGMCHFSR